MVSLACFSSNILNRGFSIDLLNSQMCRSKGLMISVLDSRSSDLCLSLGQLGFMHCFHAQDTLLTVPLSTHCQVYNWVLSILMLGGNPMIALIPRCSTPFGQHQESGTTGRSKYRSMRREFISYSQAIRLSDLTLNKVTGNP